MTRVKNKSASKTTQIVCHYLSLWAVFDKDLARNAYKETYKKQKRQDKVIGSFPFSLVDIMNNLPPACKCQDVVVMEEGSVVLPTVALLMSSFFGW